MVKFSKIFGKKKGHKDDQSLMDASVMAKGPMMHPSMMPQAIQAPMMDPMTAAAYMQALPQQVPPQPVHVPVCASNTTEITNPILKTQSNKVPEKMPTAEEPSTPAPSTRSNRTHSTRQNKKDRKTRKSASESPSPEEESRLDDDAGRSKGRTDSRVPSRDDISEARDREEEADSEQEDEPTELDVMPSADSADEDPSITSSGYRDEGTVETYEDDHTAISTRVTSTDTYEHEVVQNNSSYAGSVAASEAVGDQKKFFHKDVVLHHLPGESAHGESLVIRAMYFVPKPKTVDHIVVRIEASTVSARDCMQCRGIGLSKKNLPFVPGFEIIGTVQTLGENARADGHFKEGDRVAGISTNGGGNSRFISLPSSRLTKISTTVKSTSAVCLIHDYMAAFQALRVAKKSGSPFTGMNILVTDGFSPVGQAVINLASLEGANIYCTADESKHAYLATLGAKCFSIAPETWLPSASGTFDVVIDNLCVDSYSSSWFALNQKGTLVCMSPIYSFDRNYDGTCAALGDFRDLQQKWAAMKAKYIMTQTAFFDSLRECDENPEQFKQDLRYLTFLLEKGEINPKIAEKVSLEDVPDAQRLLSSGKANGTIVCVPWIEHP